MKSFAVGLNGVLSLLCAPVALAIAHYGGLDPWPKPGFEAEILGLFACEGDLAVTKKNKQIFTDLTYRH